MIKSNKRTVVATAGRKLLVLSIVLSCVAFAPRLYADTVFGIYAGAHLWQPELKGTIGQAGSGFDSSGDFNGGDSDSQSMYVAVEHFIPLVPNVMVRKTPATWSGFSESASGTLAGLITLDGEVSAEMDVDMTDATLYYELLDNWISLDVGVTARRLDGYITATETTSQNTDRVEVRSTVPMLYGHARFDLPFSGLAIGVRGNGLAFSDNRLIDLEAYLHLEVDLIPAIDFGIQGGIRRLSLDIQDLDSWNSDASLEGAYVGLTAHF